MKPRENPFRVERMHSLRFEPVDVTWAELWSRLESMHVRGAIVGPHGSGKSTLLRQIGDELERGGRAVVRLSLNDESSGAQKRETVRQIERCPAGTVVLLDGYEQLSGMQRLRVVVKSRAAGGLLITSHRRTLLPTLLRTRTSPQVLATLIARLAPADAVDAAAVEQLWHDHRGDIRAALMALYDRYAARPPESRDGQT